MKRIPCTIIIVALIDILFFFPVIWVIAAGAAGISFVGVYPLDVELSFKNAPENTAFVDMLVEREGSGKFSEFTEPPKRYTGYTTDENGSARPAYELLDIGGDSEIARLDDNGFVSVAAHYGHLNILENGSMRLFADDGTLPVPSYVCEDFRAKAAYVDENGNVLGITDLAKQRYNGSRDYTLSADGGSLVLGYPGRPDWFERLMLGILFVIEGRALLELAVFVLLAIRNALVKLLFGKRERSEK